MRVPGSSEGENSRTLFQVLQTVRLSQLLDEQLKFRIPLHRGYIKAVLGILIRMFLSLQDSKSGSVIQRYGSSSGSFPSLIKVLIGLK
jgi:hypothetical protein